MAVTPALRLFLAAVTCLALADGASAQGGEAQEPGAPAEPARGIRIDGNGQPYRAWDFAVTTGPDVDNNVENWLPRVSDRDNWHEGWVLQFDIGRYWSSHLKTEASVAWLSDRDHAGFEELQVAGRPVQTLWWADGRRAYVGGAVTWQFLDNVFAHPFVSAGIRAHVADVRRERLESAWTMGFPSATVRLDPVNEHVTVWQARPYVAAGYKSYFANGRTFVRSEFSMGFSQRGVAQWGLRAGVGFDF